MVSMFKNRLELVKNLMQIMHITLIFVQEVPVVYISSLVLTFFKHILYVWGFLLFSVFFFKVNAGVFLHNRVATLNDT